MKIINKLTKRHLFKNKKRTLVTIIAVTLTSTLLFSLGFAFSSYQKSEIKNYERSEADHDAYIENMTYESTSILKSNKDIKRYEYISKIYDTDFLAYKTGGDTVKDCYLEIYTISDGFKYNLQYGRLPENDSEVAILNVIDLGINSTFKTNVTDINGNTSLKEYKVVGIFNTSLVGGMALAFTKDDKSITNDSPTNYYIYLKNKKDAYDKLFSLAKELNLEETYEVGLGTMYENLYPNRSLLELYGNYQNYTTRAIIYVSLIIILTVLSIACTIIIYNSFAISVQNRKKDFGILKSVGMTNKQIRKLVFREAFFISLIAIPLGFLISYIFVSVVISYINFIQNGFKVYTIGFDITYTLICLVFIILTILYSAFFPAMRASSITPLEAIRQNKDIKIKRNKTTIFDKIFGIHGFIAHCNMRRNKSKYKIAVLGSTISIVLFMTVATFINYFEKDFSDNNYERGIFMRASGDIHDITNDLKPITSLDIVTDYMISESKPAELIGDFSKFYTKSYKEKVPSDKLYTAIVRLDEDSYASIKKQYHIKNDNPLFINLRKIYEEDDKHKIINVFDRKSDIRAKICDRENSDNCSKSYELNIIDNLSGKLKNFEFYGLLIVNDNIFDSFNIKLDYDTDIMIDMLSSDYVKIDSVIKEFLDKTNYSYEFNNYGIELIQEKNNFKCYGIVLYTLIMLFAFISITSIVNTISASMNLRKREFAILKSVGLDKKGFNKMLTLESLLLTIRTIIYGSIFSIIVVYFIQNTFNLGKKKYTFMQIFPVKYFVLTIIIVFIVITLTIFMQMKRLKKDNIIETIKNENI